MQTSHGWFDVKQFPHGVTMIAEPGHYDIGQDQIDAGASLRTMR